MLNPINTGLLSNFAKIIRDVIPVLTACADEMSTATKSIDPGTRKSIDFMKSVQVSPPISA